MVSQVVFSSANDRGLFNLYIKFDWAPDPYVATKFLSKCCLELNGLHFEVYDPWPCLTFTVNLTLSSQSEKS